MSKKIGYILVAGSLLIVFYIWQANLRSKPKPFSNYTLLVSSWDKYKYKFIDENGRVIDFENNEITTSEGQSYAMLRAVWGDDRTTFDKVWNWTKNTIRRPDDQLFSWRWGKKQNGELGVIENGGINSAADADTDIALALIFAGRRWNDEKYNEEARLILEDIWKIETKTIGSKRYLIAGNWAEGENEIVVNPSYWAPYAWRIFAQEDSQRDWNSLIGPAYEALEQMTSSKIDMESSAGLPPNWASIDKKTGRVVRSSLAELNTDYSFDAIRVPFRIALDYQWFQEPRAKTYLKRAFTRLKSDYEGRGRLASAYDHSGKIIDRTESPAMYATALGYFMSQENGLGQRMYQEKIIELYSNDQNNFREDLPYYDQNWLWFGAGLFNNFLTFYE